MTRPLLDVVREVKGPRPLLPRDAEADLSDRQRTLLAQLHEVFADGFAHLTMGEIAPAARTRRSRAYTTAKYPTGTDENPEQAVTIGSDRNTYQV